MLVIWLSGFDNLISDCWKIEIEGNGIAYVDRSHSLHKDCCKILNKTADQDTIWHVSEKLSN